MRLPHGEVHTSADLVDYTLERLARGYMEPAHRELDVPVIAFLDELAATRSDWIPAVAVTLHALAETGGKNHLAALLQLLSTGVTGPAFVDTAEDILNAHGDLRTSAASGLRGLPCRKRLKEIASHLRTLAQHFRKECLQVVFFGDQVRAMPIDNAEQLTSAAIVSLTETPQVFPVPMPLAWLRRFAFFVPRIAEHVPVILEQLAATERADAVGAVGEYLLHGGDQALLAPTLRRWFAEQPRWLESIGNSAHERVNGRPLSAIVGDALILAAEQLDTGPVDLVVH